MRKFLLTGVSFAFLVGFFQTNDAHSESKQPVLLACNVNGRVQVTQGGVTLCYGGDYPHVNDYCSAGTTGNDALAACQAAFPGAVTNPTLHSSLDCPIAGYNQSTWEHHLCMSNPLG